MDMASDYLERPLRSLTQYRDELAARLAALPPGSPCRAATGRRLAALDREIAALHSPRGA